MNYSFIVPVYNRPNEIYELLESLSNQFFNGFFEVVIIEDGSKYTCEKEVDKFRNKLSISYYFKTNSGPGDSRNFGMKKAKGDYFIILDSDCILPKDYLLQVDKALKNVYVDCFGGPDAALNSFSYKQKAINFAMTSFLTTGGIRGGTERINRFEPRSFNMGLSRKAFEISGGFSNIHPGEDPDLSMRLWDMGYDTQLLPLAYVYHKRRINWTKFYKQVYLFGKVRPIINSWHPKYNKIIYFSPFIFVIGFVFALILTFFCIKIMIGLYLFYFIFVLILSFMQTKSFIVALLSIIAVFIQFYGYGMGFVKSYIKIILLGQNPKVVFPELFFDSIS